MRISRIKLVNFRCHSVFEKELPAGINLLIGKNGSGKSSVLEAIGILFCDDSGRGGKLEDTVGPKKKSADIEVEFLAKDGSRWLVKRRIGQGSHSNRLFRWQGEKWQPDETSAISSLVGLETSGSKEVFRSMIIAEQNRFVQPFLGTSTERTTVFDRVFGISQWRELGARADLEEPFKKAVAGLEAKKAMLEEESGLVEERGLGGREDHLKTELSRLHTRMGLLSTANQAVMTCTEALRARDAALEETARLGERRDEIQNELTALMADREWLAGHEAALAGLAGLERALNGVRACREAALQVEAAGTNIRGTESRLADARLELERVVGEVSRMGAADKDYEAADRISAPLVVALESAWDELAPLQERSAAARAALEATTGRGEDAAELASRRERLLAEHSRYQELQALRESLLREKEDVQARHKALQEQRQILGTGRCPLLGETCRNLAGRGSDAEGEIGRLLEELSLGTRQAAERLNEVTAEMARFEKAGGQLGAVTQAIAEAEKRETERREREVRLREIETVCRQAEERFDAVASSLANIPGFHPLKQAIPERIWSSRGQDRQVFLEHLRKAQTAWQAGWRLEREQLTALVGERASRQKRCEDGESAVRADRADLERARDAYRSVWRRIRDEEGVGQFVQTLPPEPDLAALTVLEDELDARRTPLASLREEAGARRGRLAGEEGLHDRLGQLEARRKEEDGILRERETGFDAAASVLALSCRAIGEPGPAAPAVENLESLSALTREIGLLREDVSNAIGQTSQALEGLRQEQENLRRLRESLASTLEHLGEARRRLDLVQRIRGLLKDLGPWISKYALPLIAREATRHFRRITGRSERILWTHTAKDEYLVSLAESEEDSGVRSFVQLSGGEQVAVALAVRAALVESLSSSGFVIFDEPTINLDIESRRNLAGAFKAVFGKIEQAFVITHDDSFEAMADNEIRFD